VPKFWNRANNSTRSNTYQMKVSGLLVDVVRKDIKNLNLRVYPPDGRVRVAVPLRVSDRAVLRFVNSKLDWIKGQRIKHDGQERQSNTECVSGETHYYQGRPCRLNVIYQTSPGRVELRNSNSIDLYVREGSSPGQRERVLEAWYRRKLKEQIPPMVGKWESIIGVEVAQWGVRRMKTRWGSCNIKARRIWLNLELIKKPVTCVEYIIVHEMVHLLERLHNDRFANLMDGFMPKWREYRDELNGKRL